MTLPDAEDDVVERLRSYNDRQPDHVIWRLNILSDALRAADVIERLQKELMEARGALGLSEERWEDLGSVIDTHGKYDNAGFCYATAKRCNSVLNGGAWDDAKAIRSLDGGGK